MPFTSQRDEPENRGKRPRDRQVWPEIDPDQKRICNLVGTETAAIVEPAISPTGRLFMRLQASAAITSEAQLPAVGESA